MEKISRILVDLDEVLADFIGGACREYGVSRYDVEGYWEPGRWDMVPPLAKALRSKGRPGPTTDNEFFARIDGREEFWATLQPMPWMPDLWELLKAFSSDVHVVTSPTHCESSYHGKVKWLKKHFGRGFSNFAITPHKEIFAMPGVVLVDDRESNVTRFVGSEASGRLTGAKGIVFPTYHNSNYRHRHDPVPYVKAQLESYL